MNIHERIRILLADDHPVFRKGLRQIIEGTPHLELIGEAGDGESACRLARELRPDVVILDVEMPKRDGFEVAHLIRQEKLRMEIIFLTMYKEEAVFNRAMELDAKGYLLKDNAADDILECIEAVTRGEYYISALISNLLVKRVSRANTFAAAHPTLGKLTPAERQILKLIAQNKTSREMGEELHISEKTVEKHRANISGKLGLHGSHALLNFALENKAHL